MCIIYFKSRGEYQHALRDLRNHGPNHVMNWGYLLDTHESLWLIPGTFED